MNDTSLAMVFAGPGKPLEPRRFALPKLRPGELLVEVTCCTLCGSDLHTFLGRRKTACPTVLGHEILGRVAAIAAGPAVAAVDGEAVRVGDRVTWSIAASCGACFYCRHDLAQKCARLIKYGHEPLRDDPLSGGLAEHCHLRAGTAVVRVPDGLPDEIACPANCATATVAAALRTAGDVRDRAVLVQGCGMLGLTACAMARVQGARAVIACDLDAGRLALAERFGATERVDVSPGIGVLTSMVDHATDGRGVDVALELSGAREAFEQGIDRLRIGGRYVLVGSVFPAPPVALDAEQVVRRMLSIHGVHNYAPRDLTAAVEFLSAHGSAYPFAELVSDKHRLADADRAFAQALSSGAPRIAVVP